MATSPKMGKPPISKESADHWSGRPDLNRGPPRPKRGALTELRYAPSEKSIMRRLKSRKQTGHNEIPSPSHFLRSPSDCSMGLFAISPANSHTNKRSINYRYNYIYIDPNSTPANGNIHRYTAGLPVPARACGNRYCRRDQATSGIHHLPASLL